MNNEVKIEVSYSRLKKLDELKKSLNTYSDNSKKAHRKFKKKNKLRIQIESILNSEAGIYTEMQLKELRENSILLNSEIALINKKNIGCDKKTNQINKEIEELVKSLEIKDYRKIYIIDTNIFIDYPNILDHINFDELIIMSKTVIDELDGNKLKREIAFNVREAIRNITDYKGNNMIFGEADRSILPDDYRKNGDNLILSVAIKCKKYNPVIITNDNIFKLKAKGEGIRTIGLDEFKGLK